MQRYVALRRATLEDASAVHCVHMSSIRGLAGPVYSAAQVEAWSGERTPQSYHAPINEQFVLVAEADAEVVGFAQLDDRKSTVVAVYVSARFARQGIGLQLLRGLEQHALSVGLHELHLLSSLNAVEFYAHAGYTAGGLSEHVVSSGVALPCRAMSRALR
jgi:GNAT superfamily N-acetyltransferase